MILSGTLLAFVGVCTLLFTAIILAIVGNRLKKDTGKNPLSNTSKILFGLSLIGGLATTVIGGIQSAPGSMVSMNQGQFSEKEQKEVEALLEKIDENPSNFEAREKLGYLYLSVKDFSSTFEVIHPVLQEDPNRVDALAQIGVILFVSQEPDTALQYLDRALTLNPKHLQSLYYKGLVLFMGKQDPDAAKQVWAKYQQYATPEHEAWDKVQMFLDRTN